jgi:xanthine/CO dehydrogenase XdhC/CoxF family maturation factor
MAIRENRRMRSPRSGVRLDTSLESLVAHAPREEAAVLATLVATAGSTYRKPGARMVIRADGSFSGLLSGGCLEADLAAHAREVLASLRPRAVDYDMRGPDDTLFGLGAGCEGALRILLEPLSVGTLAAAALAKAGEETRSGQATSLVIVHRSSSLALGTYGAAALAAANAAPMPQLLAAARTAVEQATSTQVDFADDDAHGASGAHRVNGEPGANSEPRANGDCGRAFIQFLAPPPHLLICGAGPDAEPVVSAARNLGWCVTVIDHRPAYAEPARFPGALVLHAAAQELKEAVPLELYHAAVVMSHHLPTDLAYLRALSAAGAPDYVGLLGPAARRRRIAMELAQSCDSLLKRLRGPVGIDIGAVTPEGIALSIVSEIHAWLAGRASVA